MSANIFGCHRQGVLAFMCEGWDAAQHLTMHRTTPTTKNCPPKSSTVLWLRNPGFYTCSRHWAKLSIHDILYCFTYVLHSLYPMEGRRKSVRNLSVITQLINDGAWLQPSSLWPQSSQGGEAAGEAFHALKWRATAGHLGPCLAHSNGSASFTEWRIGHSCGQSLGGHENRKLLAAGAAAVWGQAGLCWERQAHEGTGSHGLAALGRGVCHGSLKWHRENMRTPIGKAFTWTCPHRRLLTLDLGTRSAHLGK